jgi:hypothetical protein
MDFGGGRRATDELFNIDAVHKRDRSRATGESCTGSCASPAAGSAANVLDEDDFNPASISKSRVYAPCATSLISNP